LKCLINNVKRSNQLSATVVKCATWVIDVSA
jgi:hypothetical protein